MRPSCSTCRHFANAPRGPESRGECRAQPPSMGREVQFGGEDHPVVLAAWPLVLPADVCGEHAPPDPFPAPAAAPAADKPKPKPRPKAE